MRLYFFSIASRGRAQLRGHVGCREDSSLRKACSLHNPCQVEPEVTHD